MWSWHPGGGENDDGEANMELKKREYDEKDIETVNLQ